jgi:hypothetical protein
MYRVFQKKALQLWKLIHVNLFQGYVQCFELSKCSTTQRVLPGIVTVQCDFHWYSKCYCVASITKTFTLKGVKAIHPEGWTVCTLLSINVFVTLATHQHLEYSCKPLFETSCIDQSFLDVGNSRRWVVSSLPGRFIPGKELTEPIV